MLRHLYWLCLLALLVPGRAAYAQWQWLNPKPNTYAGKVVRFVDARHGLVLQETGQVLRTDDAGLTWQESRRFADACDLDVTPQGTGYLLTLTGALWRTPDAGLSWERVSAPPVQPLSYPYLTMAFGAPPALLTQYSRVYAVSTDTLLETTSDGLLRRSTDGGRSWRQFTTPVTQVLSSAFPSGRVGYLGTYNGRIFKTTDGGATWTKLTEVGYSPAGVTMLRFVSPLVGFAHRDYYDLLRTEDGGRTWTLVANQMQVTTDMRFLSATVGFAVGEYGTIYTTTTGGASWTAVGPAVTGGYINGNQWASIWFTSPTTGYVTGRSSWGPIMHTTDGGRTWLSLAGLLGTIKALAFPGHGLTGYALSSNGLLKTTDGGDTWVQQATVGGNWLACPDVNTVVIAGNGGVVNRSGDGGLTWQTTVIPPRYSFTNNLVTLQMVNSQLGYVAGENNSLGQVLARTQDGGQTWQVISGQLVGGLRDFNFITPTTGFAIGYQGLYKTTDGGQSWQALPTGNTFTTELSDLCFVDEQVGYAVDDYCQLFKTQDGGATWQRSQLNRSRYAVGHGKYIHFLNRSVGCVQTDNSHVFRTTDGGQTWVWEFNLGSQAADYTQGGQALVIGGSTGMLVRRSLTTNPLPFQLRVLPPQVFTDSSAVLIGRLSIQNCLADSAHFEYGPASSPGFGHKAVAFRSSWHGTDSVQTRLLTSLDAATTYRVRLWLWHNGAGYYGPDTVFTTLPAPPVELAAYPNPTTGYVRVLAPHHRASPTVEVRALDGTLLRTATGSGVDLSGLPGGLYILSVRTDDQVRRYRVVKQ